jgi:hypothetical protein
MKLRACSAEGFFMHSHSRSSSSMAVMGEGFRRSFPVEHDLPPVMSALIGRLAALESKPQCAAVASRQDPFRGKSPVGKPQTG